MKKNIKILIAYHKPAEVVKSEIYVPIQVGRNIMLQTTKDGKLSTKEQNYMIKNFIGDDTGDNISSLNRYFNEMSAIYWGYKNQEQLSNPDFIGLMHYRRHFIFNEKIKKPKSVWLNNSPVYCYDSIDDKYKKDILDEDSLSKLLDNYNIICSKMYNANNLNDRHYYRNAKERFAEVSCTDKIWYEKMFDIVKFKHPKYYKELLYLETEPNHYLCNMFVMEKDIFNEYCNFVFDVLFELYNLFKLEHVDTWQTRAIGFLAEFLTSIFIADYRNNHQGKVKELNLTYVENTEKRHPIQRVRDLIYSKKRYSGYKKITVFGFSIKYKNKKNNNQMLSISCNNEKMYKNLEDMILRANRDIEVKMQALLTHQESFNGYKNKFCGKDVYLCACGPTAANFIPQDNNAIYVGVNRSFLNPKLNLDYLFIQDYLKPDNIQAMADNYRPNECIKFYGQISKTRLPEIFPIVDIPMTNFINANAKKYILENGLHYSFAKDILIEPIGDLAGVVFSAMQFILYTHPKKIYLVGCDCSKGYFYNMASDNNHEYQIKNWLKIRYFAQKYYPDTEIISINPVGLKGLFKDIYKGENDA